VPRASIEFEFLPDAPLFALKYCSKSCYVRPRREFATSREVKGVDPRLSDQAGSSLSALYVIIRFITLDLA
jgi:hypothetical protein